jgi:tetratricopeptide (TPR) repeat protein
LVW